MSCPTVRTGTGLELLGAVLPLLWIATASGFSTNFVQQSPRELVVNLGDAINLTCSHHDKKYDKMYWYRQGSGQGLQLLGFLTFKQMFLESMFQNTEDAPEPFTMSGDAEAEGFLEASAVRAEDRAVYYCAVGRAR